MTLNVLEIACKSHQQACLHVRRIWLVMIATQIPEFFSYCWLDVLWVPMSIPRTGNPTISLNKMFLRRRFRATLVSAQPRTLDLPPVLGIAPLTNRGSEDQKTQLVSRARRGKRRGF